MNNRKKVLIILAGPTAVGKTETAIRLATHFNTEIINADSRQCYKEFVLGTAPPSIEDRKKVPHHLVQTQSIKEPLSAGAFARLALEKINKIFEKRDYVVLTGGSGLYLRAVTHGLNTFPEIPEAIREKIQQQYEKNGLSWLQQEVERADPEYYAIVEEKNPARLLRALEVITVSGQPFSNFWTADANDNEFFSVYLALIRSRNELYERIDQRVDQMIDAGLEEEVFNLYKEFEPTNLLTVGYREWADYLQGDISREEVINLIKRNSRRYAKRQLTWLRRDGFWRWFLPGQVQDMIDYINLATEHKLGVHFTDNNDSWSIEAVSANTGHPTYALSELDLEQLNEKDIDAIARQMKSQRRNHKLTFAKNG